MRRPASARRAASPRMPESLRLGTVVPQGGAGRAPESALAPARAIKTTDASSSSSSSGVASQDVDILVDVVLVVVTTVVPSAVVLDSKTKPIVVVVVVLAGSRGGFRGRSGGEVGGVRAELSRRAAESRPRELESSRLGAVAPRGGSCPRAGLVRQWARWARAAERGGACCSGHHVYGHGNVVARIPRVKPRCPTSERDYSGRHLSALGPSTTTGCIGSSERGAQESPRRALVAPKGSQRRARIVRGTEQLGAALARAPKWGPQEEPHVHPNGGPQNSLRRHTR